MIFNLTFRHADNPGQLSRRATRSGDFAHDLLANRLPSLTHLPFNPLRILWHRHTLYSHNLSGLVRVSK